MRRGRRAVLGAGLVLALGTGLSLGGGGIAHAAEPTMICIPIPLLVSCGGDSAPSGTPTPTPSPSGGVGSGGGSGGSGSSSSGSDSGSGSGGSSSGSGVAGGSGVGGGSGAAAPGSSPAAGTAPATQWGAPTTDDSTVYTLPAAQLGGSSIAIGGIPTISLVTVPLVNGQRATVVKLTADSVAMNGFSLDVRGQANGTSAVETDDRMELRGHVVIYLDSATATLGNGQSLTLGASTPPPGGELPTEWLRVSLGLVGATADSIEHDSTSLKVRAGTASGPNG